MSELSGIGLSPAAAITPVDKNDPEALKKAAKGIESMFLYELIKTMRESAQSSEKSTFGSSTYMGMFDMELSRVLADRGIGLTEVLLRSLEHEKPAEAGADSDAPATQEVRNGVFRTEARKNPVFAPNVPEEFRKSGKKD